MPEEEDAYNLYQDKDVYGHLESQVLGMRNGRKIIKKIDFVTDEQNAKKMDWLRQYKQAAKQAKQARLTEADLVTAEELIKYSVISGSKDFKSIFKHERGKNIPSSLEHLNKEIILVEDG